MNHTDPNIEAARAILKAHAERGDYLTGWRDLVGTVGQEAAGNLLWALDDTRAQLVIRDATVENPLAPVPGELYSFDLVATCYLKSGLTRSLARLIDLALASDAPSIRSGSERVGLRAFADACRDTYLNQG